MSSQSISTNLYEVLWENAAEISDAVVIRLRQSGPPNYQNMDKELLQGRADSLVDSFIRSVEKKPAIFINYIQSITEKRISEGIMLHEIQAVLQILEEKAWLLVIDNIPQEQQVRCLSQITFTIGSAKDRIGHVYLKHLEAAERRASKLQRRVDELSKGTDSGPIQEGELPG